MKAGIKNAALVALVLLMAFACKRDELDFDNLDDLAIQRQIAIPLVNVNMTVPELDEITGSSADYITIIIDNDTSALNIIGQEVEWDIELSGEDSEEKDTIEFELEYAELHFTFENFFPAGFKNASLVVLDSLNDVIIDTIPLNPSDSIFLAPAPVDSDNKVINADVVESKVVTIINPVTAEKLLNEATHLLFKADLIASNNQTLEPFFINADNRLRLHLGINAKGTYFLTN